MCRWNGFKAYRSWICCYKHFNEKTYDIKKNYNVLSVKLEDFMKRNDAQIFTNIANSFSEKEWVAVSAVNLMYGNESAPYDTGKAIANYNLFVSKKQAMNAMLQHDFSVFNKYNVLSDDYKGMLRLLTRNLISFETLVILNKIVPLTKSIRGDKTLGLALTVLKPLLLRIDKANTFVYTSEEKLKFIKENAFNDDLTFNTFIFDY